MTTCCDHSDKRKLAHRVELRLSLACQSHPRRQEMTFEMRDWNERQLVFSCELLRKVYACLKTRLLPGPYRDCDRLQVGDGRKIYFLKGLLQSDGQAPLVVFLGPNRTVCHAKFVLRQPMLLVGKHSAARGHHSDTRVVET